ncbi:branched-chain amino acid ABC transporter permease [Thermodesulfobacteriota bacterium]
MLSQVITGGLAVGSIYALVALGFVLIYKATDVINFAQGDMMMFCAYINFYLLTVHEFSFPIAILITLMASALMGIILERAIIRPLLNEPLFVIVIVTIGLATCLKSGAGMLWGYDTYTVPTPFPEIPYKIGNLVISATHLWIVMITLVLVTIFFFFFRYTRLGTAMRSTSEHQDAAQLMGINVKGIFSLTWIMSAVIGSAGGMLIAPLLFLRNDLGFIGLKAFPAAFLGGFGSFPGAVVGGLLLGVLESIATFYLPEGIKDVFAWLILIAILMIRPEGIFGIYEKKKV